MGRLDGPFVNFWTQLDPKHNSPLVLHNLFFFFTIIYIYILFLGHGQSSFTLFFFTIILINYGGVYINIKS